jgi:ribose transport system permease protein
MSETIIQDDSHAESDAAIPPARPPRRLDVQALAARYSLLAVWVAVIVFFSVTAPDTFPTTGTFKTVFGSQQELLFLALAVVITFVVGEFDLSVAGMLGFSATLLGVLNTQHGVGIVPACVIAVAATTMVGVVNAFIIVRLGVEAIVVTLGMATLLLGVSLWLTDLTTVTGLSDSFASIAATTLLGLPLFFWYGLALTLLLAYVLHRTPLGRHMTFVGASREVARLAGVRVDRIRFCSYVASGCICGVAGMLSLAFAQGYDPNTSAGDLLPAFSAAFLGTAVIYPGRFNPIGAFIAVYFLLTGIVGLQLLGASGWIAEVFYGAALIIAITVATRVNRLRQT